MDIRISPSALKGHIDIPASKSCAHRALICAALADGVSRIGGINLSADIQATIDCMTALGAEFQINGTDIAVRGISGRYSGGYASCDCRESGSTLRFVMPIAAALGIRTEFSGTGRLPQRPIDIYKRELGRHNVSFISETMPYITEGRLTAGRFELEGNVSSQFVTGLLFALPLLEGDSEIVMTSRLESRPYVDITVNMLSRFGISISENGSSFSIRGGQSYTPCDMNVEGDYSQAAFFFAANAIGSDVSLGNLDADSKQGDKRITEYTSVKKWFHADCSDIPDLVPILSVLGAYSSGESVIYNAARLRIKESDRLETAAAMINALGGKAEITADGLIIKPAGQLTGGIVDGCGDHRIVMAAAIAALGCKGDTVIRGAEAVNKSYPDFFRDYTKLGGKANVIDPD